MAKSPGEDTGEFGYSLRKLIEKTYINNEFTVFYDHGNKATDPFVAAIEGFYFHQEINIDQSEDTKFPDVNNGNQFANIDVLVVNNENEVVLLIEIEESGMSPKKLIGDIFTILMCNRISVKKNYYKLLPKSKLIIAGVVPEKGDGRYKIDEVIYPRLIQFHGPMDTINTDNIQICYGIDITSTLDNLKNIVIDILDDELI